MHAIKENNTLLNCQIDLEEQAKQKSTQRQTENQKFFVKGLRAVITPFLNDFKNAPIVYFILLTQAFFLFFPFLFPTNQPLTNTAATSVCREGLGRRDGQDGGGSPVSQCRRLQPNKPGGVEESCRDAEEHHLGGRFDDDEEKDDQAAGERIQARRGYRHPVHCRQPGRRGTQLQPDRATTTHGQLQERS